VLTIHRIDIVVVPVLAVIATAAAIYDHKVANLVITLFALSAIRVIVKAAVKAISDVLVTTIEDAYDAGKDETERRADVLDLALHRKS
jgi:hypothetical protein